MQSANGAQILNITPLFPSSYRLTASLFPAPVMVIVPLANIYVLQ